MQYERPTKLCGEWYQLPYNTASKALGQAKDPYSLDTILRNVFSADYEREIRGFISCIKTAQHYTVFLSTMEHRMISRTG